MRNLAVKGRPFSVIARAIVSIFLLAKGFCAFAADPILPINIQGRITVGNPPVAFNGLGKFKFALVHPTARQSFWSHDGTISATLEPTGFVELAVNKGLYSVLLGDTSIPGMTKPITADVFANPDVRLRIWFDDGTHGFQRLSPDQRMAATGYAFTALRANEAAVLTGNITLQQAPPELVRNNTAGINLTGAFTGDGSGLVGIRGSTPWQVAAAGVNDAFPNTGYLVASLAETTILLPETASMRVGDITRVAGPNPGAWKIAQRAGQTIFAGDFKGSVGANWTGRATARAWRGICASEDFTRLAAVVYNNGPVVLSTNSGATWYLPPLPPAQNWRSIACSADGMRLVAASEPSQTAQGNLFISPDGGDNWSARANVGNRIWSSVASSADGTNLVAVPMNGPLVISADGGTVWTAPINAGTKNWISVACSKDGTNIIAAVNGERLWASKDFGATWTPLSAGVGAWTAVASSADGMKLAATMDGGNIFTSINGGTNWTAHATPPAVGVRWVGITSSADGNKLAAVANPGQIAVSLNGGETWTFRDASRAWYGITCSADGTKFAATAQSGLIYISDSPKLRFTTAGEAGALVGDEFSAIELQHIGGGKFMPLSSSGAIFAY